VPGARDAIASYVERRSLQHREHELGHVVAFGLDAANAATVTVLLAAPDDAAVSVEAAGPAPVDRDQWNAALWTLNEWNATVRVPKAVLLTSEDDAAVAHIVLQAWLPFDDALPSTVVDVFLDTAISGACLFWQGVTGGDEGSDEGSDEGGTESDQPLS
jgi:hypothetical protein